MKMRKKRYNAGVVRILQKAALVLAILCICMSANAASVRAVQSGTLSINSNGGTNTVNVSVTSVDTSTTFLMFQTKHNSNRPVGSTVRGRLVSPTNIEFVRVSNETPPGSPIDIQWYLLEYSSGVKVQRGVLVQSNTGTSMNTTITAVASTTRAFVLWSKTPKLSDTVFSGDDPVIGELTTTSNLQFRWGQSASDSHIINWQVIEFTDSVDINVQKGSITTMNASTTSVTATLPTAVDPTATFILVGYRITASSNNNIGARLFRARLTSATSIVIDRSVAGSEAVPEIFWQAVEIKDGTRVQSGNVNLASGSGSATIGISAVDLGRSVAFASVQGEGGQNTGRSPYVSDDVPGVGSATFALSSSTQVSVNRNSTVAQSDFGWFVVEFGNSGILPVQLASFTGRAVNNTNVQLDWTTVSEVNNYGFFVQRRSSGNEPFADIAGAFIPGHGTTTLPQSYQYLDAGVESGTWQYRLKQVDYDGSTNLSDPIVVDILTSVKEGGLPTESRLNQNFPNPFNPSTTLSFAISQTSFVSLTIYNYIGQAVGTIVNETLTPGSYSRAFHAQNLSSGMYLYRIEVRPIDGGTPLTAVRTMALVK